MSAHGYLLQSCEQRRYQKLGVKKLIVLKGLPAKCVKCGTEDNLTVDHKLPKKTNPKARGLLANYQVMCKRCNELKGHSKNH